MSSCTNQIVSFLSVHEHERHKGVNPKKIGMKGKRWGKECEVKLGRKWMKNTSKNSV